MQNVRIGTDISLQVLLSDKKYGDTGNPINIQSLTAVVVNTTLEQKFKEELKNKTRFISRYPIEPRLDDYTATVANLNHSGFPTYHVMPNSHMSRAYAGYGVVPEFDKIYRPCRKYSLTDYRTPVERTATPNIVYVYFPAEAQLYPGKYKLVIIAQIYVAGYGKNNLRTVTVDYEDAFEIVTKSEDADAEGTIEIKLDEGSSEVYDNYVESGNYTGSGYLDLHMVNGDVVNVDLTEEFNWGEFD